MISDTKFTFNKLNRHLYYYDCPYKAAYMVKEFGIRVYLNGVDRTKRLNFCTIEFPIEIPREGLQGQKQVFKHKTDGTLEKEWEWVDTGEQEAVSLPELETTLRVYVDPRDNLIFEPQYKDLGQLNGEEGSFNGKKWIFRDRDLQGEAEIIFRGKPFISPKII